MNYTNIILLIIFVISIVACSYNQPTVPSGHPYTHHIQNNGYRPKQGDLIQYHFIQRNNQGVIHSTYDEGSPKRFRIPNVDPTNDEFDRITPLTEAMMEMSEGDSLTLELLYEFMPAQLNGASEGESMFFDIKLEKISSADDILREEAKIVEKGLAISAKIQKLSKQYKAGELDDLQELDGVQYFVEQRGNGKKLKNSDIILVHFSGHLLSSGKQYLDTYSKKRPYQLKIGAGRVIEAWEKILPTCSEGDQLYMFVPYQKAYGVAGSPGLGIPEKTDLAIYMEIVSLK